MSHVKEIIGVVGSNNTKLFAVQSDTTSWITFSCNGYSCNITPEAAKLLASKLNRMANAMIKRRSETNET